MRKAEEHTRGAHVDTKHTWETCQNHSRIMKKHQLVGKLELLAAGWTIRAAQAYAAMAKYLPEMKKLMDKRLNRAFRRTFLHCALDWRMAAISY